MPLFDLGNDIKATERVNAPPEQAYNLAKGILEGYRKQGYKVRFTQERPHTNLEAEFSDNDGTKVRAAVAIKPAGNASSLEIKLTGKIYVGGFKGRLATDSKVQEVALDMLKKEMKKTVKDKGLAACFHCVIDRERMYAYFEQKEAARHA